MFFHRNKIRASRSVRLATSILGLLVGFQVLGKESSPLGYPVSRISFSHAQSFDDLPDLSELAKASLELDCSESVVSLFDLMRGASPVLPMSHKDFFKLSEVALHFMKSKGYEGVVVFPDPKQINPVSGKDLRKQGDTTLGFLVWVSVLKSVRLDTAGLKEKEENRLKAWMDAYLESADSIDRPIRSQFYDHFQKMGQHPSRTFKVSLGATDEPGKVDAVLRAGRRPSKQSTLSLANSGSETTGKWLFSGSFRTDQLTGSDDHLSIGLSVSDSGERRAIGGAYHIPLIEPGSLILGVGLGYSSYDASTFAVQTIDFEGDTVYLDTSLKVSPMSWRGRKHSADLELGLKWENVTAFNSLFVNSADTGLLTPKIQFSLKSRGKIRLAETKVGLHGNLLGIDEGSTSALGGIDVTDRYARVSFSHSEYLKIGNWLTGSSGSGANDYARRHLLSLRFQANWALGSDRHLPQHQFITGGTGSVRGYPESPAAGDDGYFASIEYRFPVLLADSWSWTALPFVDFGQTLVNQPFFFESDHTLLGAGLGFEFELPYGMLARFDFAKPLRELKSAGIVRDGTRSGDYRVHGLFRWNF